MMDVLLVEDHDGIAATLDILLRRLGHDARRAASGAEALAAPPADLVLLDLGLPDMDGFDVLAGMRMAGSHTPIVIMTARGDPGLRAVARDAGADGFLAKPFSIDEFVAAIDLTAISAARLAAPAVTPTPVGLPVSADHRPEAA